MFDNLKKIMSIKNIKIKLIKLFIYSIIYFVLLFVCIPFVKYDPLDPVDDPNNTFKHFINLFTKTNYTSLMVIGTIPIFMGGMIIQALLKFCKPFENLQKQGEEGVKRIKFIKHLITIIISILISIKYVYDLRKKDKIIGPLEYAINSECDKKWLINLCIIAFYVFGTIISIFISEQINDLQLLLSGTSILLVLETLFKLSNYVTYAIKALSGNFTSINMLKVILVAIITFIVFGASVLIAVFLEHVERLIKVQYANKIVGRKMCGIQSSYIPIKINFIGTMPIVIGGMFAAAFKTLINFFNGANYWQNIIDKQIQDEKSASFIKKSFFTFIRLYDALHIEKLIFVLVVCGLSYAYTKTIFNVKDISQQIQTNGGYILGVRPGKPTETYLSTILEKIAILGVFALLAIVTLQKIVLKIIEKLLFILFYKSLQDDIQNAFRLIFNVNRILILVSVFIEIKTYIKAYMANEQ